MVYSGKFVYLACKANELIVYKPNEKESKMSLSFKKFLRRARCGAALKAVAYALSTGLITVGVLLLLIKRDLLSMQNTYAILIAVAATLIVGLSLFFILRPGEKRVARRLDRELSLGERVETALEFADREGGIYELQREDTEERLSAIPLKSFKIKRITAALSVLAISASVLTASLLIPAAAEPEKPDVIVDGYEKDYRIAALRQLIERVRSDVYSEEAMRDEIVSVLELLITSILSTELESAMKSAAVTAVGDVTSILAYYNSSGTLATTLAESGSDELTALSRAFARLDDDGAEDAIDDISSLLRTGDLETGVPDFNSRLAVAIRQSGVTRTEDALYSALLAFMNGITTVVDTSPSDASKQLGDLCDDLIYAVSDALFLQTDNKRIADVVVAELIAIFALTKDDFYEGGVEPPVDSETGDLVTPPDDEDDEQEEGNSGGYGSGETLAGSNDTVYDDDENDYVKYIDVINKYYTEFDASAESFPELIREIIRSYYDKLYTPEDLLN